MSAGTATKQFAYFARKAAEIKGLNEAFCGTEPHNAAALSIMGMYDDMIEDKASSSRVILFIGNDANEIWEIAQAAYNMLAAESKSGALHVVLCATCEKANKALKTLKPGMTIIGVLAQSEAGIDFRINGRSSLSMVFDLTKGDRKHPSTRSVIMRKNGINGFILLKTPFYVDTAMPESSPHADYDELWKKAETTEDDKTIEQLRDEVRALRRLIAQMGFDADKLLSGPDDDFCRSVLLRSVTLDEEKVRNVTETFTGVFGNEDASGVSLMEKWRTAWSNLRCR